jgi:hypothetical protein
MGDRDYNQLLRALAPENYAAWIHNLYECLDDKANEMAEDARHLCGLGEEALSKQIVRFLQQKQFNATAESDAGGHVDVYVKHEQWLWCGEAKIFSGSYSYLTEGVIQLLHRYASQGHHDGGLFIYVKDKSIKEVKEKWKEKLQVSGKEDLCFQTLAQDGLSYLCFRSLHTNSQTGYDYSLRHMFISLKYKPKN